MWIWYVLAAVMVVVASCEYFAWRTGVPTIASFPSARRVILEALREAFANGDLPRGASILDLGSGSGKLTLRIAQAFPDAQVIGLELSWAPWALSVLRQRLAGAKNLRYVRADFWPYDCSRVDAAVTYLTENIIEKVGDKLRRELKPGAFVLANDTALRGDWVPVAARETGLFGMKVYVYRQGDRG